MPKLIDSEAAKAAITDIFSRHGWLPWLTAIDAIDALPDASEPAIHADRITVPPHLAEAQRVVINRAKEEIK